MIGAVKREAIAIILILGGRMVGVKPEGFLFAANLQCCAKRVSVYSVVKRRLAR